MNKKRLILYSTSCLLAILILNLAMMLFVNAYARSLWGVITGDDSSSKIISQIIKWDALKEFEIEYGNLAPSASKSNNFIFHLSKKATKENLVIAHLDNLYAFSSKSVMVDSQEPKASFVNVKDKHLSQGYSIIMTFPNTVFNINKLPKGDTFQILGAKPTRIIDTTICDNHLYVIQTNLKDISFNAVPDKGFKRNVPIGLNLWNEKKGSIIFLECRDKSNVLFIHYMAITVPTDEYEKHLNAFLQSVCEFRVLRTK